MVKRFHHWYKCQVGFRKWLLIFILNWLYWSVVQGLTMFVIGIDEAGNNPVAAFLLKTTLMALFWTVTFDAWISPWLKTKYRVKSQSDRK